MRPGSRSEAIDRQLRKIAKRQRGIISRAQVLELGLSESAISRRLKTREWTKVLPNVYRTHPDSEKWSQGLWAGRLWLGDEAVVSHRAAAVLHRLVPVPAPYEFRVPHCSYRKPVDSKGLILHRPEVPPIETMNIEGLRVTNIPLTLIDLGAVIDDDALEDIIERTINKGRVSTDELAAQLSRNGRQGRSGAGVLRRVLEKRGLHTPAVESELELEFVRFLRKHGFVEPQRQYWIIEGAFKARVDFAYPDQRIAIEVDGFESHGRREPFDRDHDRSNAITSLAWDVLHVTKAHIVEEKKLIQHLDTVGVPRQMRLEHT
jgi:very-short-patch-repair endonuclease